MLLIFYIWFQKIFVSFTVYNFYCVRLVANCLLDRVWLISWNWYSSWFHSVRLVLFLSGCWETFSKRDGEVFSAREHVRSSSASKKNGFLERQGLFPSSFSSPTPSFLCERWRFLSAITCSLLLHFSFLSLALRFHVCSVALISCLKWSRHDRTRAKINDFVGPADKESSVEMLRHRWNTRVPGVLSFHFSRFLGNDTLQVLGQLL